ncbi:glutamate synthase [Paludisphaera sp.]|uniref:glutamate synthase n=1 Tax=Paludisphaera sp. TaxID=2017432 RepID=UPI00301E044C
MANDDPDGSGGPIPVAELRDYHLINAEVVRRLDRGDRLVRLEGPSGQRLLLAGLAGSWDAVIEVAGDAGPELAAGMDAPNVVVVCTGRSADGAGAGMRSGTLLLLDPSGSATGCRLAGGSLIAADAVGPRAGLGMSGGDLILLGPVGPMAGDRQSGGRLFLPAEPAIPHAGREAVGGRRFAGDPGEGEADARQALAEARGLAARHGGSRQED